MEVEIILNERFELEVFLPFARSFEDLQACLAKDSRKEELHFGSNHPRFRELPAWGAVFFL
jgi:hypothetical protein